MMWRAPLADVVLVISAALMAVLAHRQNKHLEVVVPQRCAIVPQYHLVLHVLLVTVLNAQVADIAQAISAAMVASLAHQQRGHSQVVPCQRHRIAPVVASFFLPESL